MKRGHGPAFSYMCLHATSVNLEGKAQISKCEPTPWGRESVHPIGPGSLISTKPSEYKHKTANATTGKSIGGISPSRSCWTLRLDEYQPPPTVYFDDPEQWSFGLEWSSSGAPVERQFMFISFREVLSLKLINVNWRSIGAPHSIHTSPVQKDH